jgi:predicted 2-oxoglutarate/Fe(II)-dependent dioxygenase YbiX
MTNPLSLLDYIQYHPNVIPAEFCDEIINAVDKQGQWPEAKIEEGFIDKTIRNVNSVALSNWPELDLRLYEILSGLGEIYFKFFPDVTFSQDEGYAVLRYSVGQFYKKHADYLPSVNRVLSCVIGLNDEYEGGELYFWDGVIKYSLGKGDVLFFPANYLYPHSVEEVTAGVRYTIVTWFR